LRLRLILILILRRYSLIARLARLVVRVSPLLLLNLWSRLRRPAWISGPSVWNRRCDRRMLNHRMSLIQSLRDNMLGSIWSLQLVPINRRRGSVASWRVFARGKLAHIDRLDLRVRRRSHPFDINPPVDDDLVFNHVVVYHRGSIVDPVHFNRLHPTAPQIVVTEISQPDKRKQVYAQAEIEVRSHMHTIEAETAADIDRRMEGQGSPSAVVSASAPNHPGRSPGRVWKPYPAATLIPVPSAIMKRRPTP
jgi:hypothetical protein